MAGAGEEDDQKERAVDTGTVEDVCKEEKNGKMDWRKG